MSTKKNRKKPKGAEYVDSMPYPIKPKPPEKKRRRGSLKHQVVETLCAKKKFGVKKASVSAEVRNKSIFSVKTFETYMERCQVYVEWLRAEGIAPKTLKEAKRYVPDYLAHLSKSGYSPWTISTAASALAKLYDSTIPSFGVELPKRERTKVKRSRAPKETLFSSDPLYTFCTATGLRRHELLLFKPEHLQRKEGQWYVYVPQGKGGRPRLAPVVRSLEAITLVEQIVRVAEREGKVGEYYWKDKVPENLDIHAMRRRYAKAIYARAERDLEGLDYAGKYYCRGDFKGQVFDREALRITSEALGHSRLDVAVNSYLVG